MSIISEVLIMTTIEKRTKRLQVQIDAELLQQADIILDSVGLTQKAALTAFYKQLVIQGKIPFELQASEKDKANARLLAVTADIPSVKMNKAEFEDWLEEDEY